MVQINARSLTRKMPFFRRSFFDGIFKEGLVDFVATDTHAMPGRETCMRAGMTALKEKYGEVTERRIREMPEIFFE
jgi:tyrosine-protein phosphatase YwqE